MFDGEDEDAPKKDEIRKIFAGGNFYQKVENQWEKTNNFVLDYLTLMR